MDDGWTDRQTGRRNCPATSSKVVPRRGLHCRLLPAVTRMLIFQAPWEAGSPVVAVSPQNPKLFGCTHICQGARTPERTHRDTYTSAYIHAHHDTHCIYTRTHASGRTHAHYIACTHTYQGTHQHTRTPQGMHTTTHTHAHQETHSFPSHRPIREQPEQPHWCRNTASLSQRLWSVDMNENANGWET